MNAPTKLTPAREAVLSKVQASGAHKFSPLPLHGAEHRNGSWLVEQGLLLARGGGFYPLPPPRQLPTHSPR
jgi:hypothetical protein